MPTRSRTWSNDDVEQLKVLVLSGASAIRAAVALRRTVAMTKLKAKKLGVPFRPEAELKKERRRIFEARD
jgi:hypothetical protein